MEDRQSYTRLSSPYIAVEETMELEESTNSVVQLVPKGVFDGHSVAEITKRSATNKRTPKGGTLKRADAAWYVFDNVSCDQAEDLLRQHGEHGTYLVAHFHDPVSYGLSIRLNEGINVVYKHYAIGISGPEFQAEGIPGSFYSIEELVTAVGEKINQKLVPIFHKFNKDNHEFSITLSAEAPPDYNAAEKFPQAARRPLPIIVPIRPTLRRMMGNGQRPRLESRSGELPEELMATTGTQVDYTQKGCCWKAFHTDVNGKWYKPHKAGPVTAFLLVIGWILFLVLFGWIVGLALILVFILVMFAYLLNFICTGRCRVEEDGETPVVNDQGRTGDVENGTRNGTGNRNGHGYF